MTVLVEITKTARGFGREQEWRRYSVETNRFDNAADALRWIDEHYPRKKNRRPIFVDSKSQGTIQTGWIYPGRDCHNYTQDWVSLREVLSETERTAKSLDVSKLRKGGDHASQS
jgi:hypothetical protein